MGGVSRRCAEAVSRTGGQDTHRQRQPCGRIRSAAPIIGVYPKPTPRAGLEVRGKEQADLIVAHRITWEVLMLSCERVAPRRAVVLSHTSTLRLRQQTRFFLTCVCCRRRKVLDSKRGFFSPAASAQSAW